MKSLILDKNKSYSFSDYFNLPYSSRDILNELGYAFSLKKLELPNDTVYLCGQVAKDSTANISEQTRSMLETATEVAALNINDYRSKKFRNKSCPCSVKIDSG